MGEISERYSLLSRIGNTNNYPYEVLGGEQQRTWHTKKGNMGWTLSGLYCMYLVVFGGVLVITEALPSTPVDKVFVEAFFFYLYVTGILYMAYMYLVAHKLSCGVIAHAGSLYLKIGAVLFGLGNIVGNGMQLGAYFDPDPNCERDNILLALTPSIHIIFILTEISYLLTKSGMCINKQKGLVKMGIMHLVACNLCTWLRVLATETTEALEGHRFSPLKNVTFYSSFGDCRDSFFTTNRSGTDSAPQNNSCSYAKAGHLEEVVEMASPFVYPCTIEFSLIAAGILYIHWSNVGKDDEHDHVSIQLRHTSDGEPEHPGHGGSNFRIHINCKSSALGLLFGTAVITATVVVMIVFSKLIESDERSETAVKSYQYLRLVLYVVAIMALAMTTWSLRKHDYDESRVISLDRSLLLIALGGMYLLATFTLFAGILITKSKNLPIFTYTKDVPILTITTALLQMTQSTIQTMCLLDGLHRLPPSGDGPRYIRHCVVFLMLTNISLWLMSTFEVKMPRTDPVIMHFYLDGPWIIISHFSCPLVIFFRFHSAACFFDIWKDSFYGE